MVSRMSSLEDRGRDSSPKWVQKPAPSPSLAWLHPQRHHRSGRECVDRAAGCHFLGFRPRAWGLLEDIREQGWPLFLGSEPPHLSQMPCTFI